MICEAGRCESLADSWINIDSPNKRQFAVGHKPGSKYAEGQGIKEPPFRGGKELKGNWRALCGSCATKFRTYSFYGDSQQIWKDREAVSS